MPSPELAASLGPTPTPVVLTAVTITPFEAGYWFSVLGIPPWKSVMLPRLRDEKSLQYARECASNLARSAVPRFMQSATCPSAISCSQSRISVVLKH